MYRTTTDSATIAVRLQKHSDILYGNQKAMLWQQALINELAEQLLK